MTPDECLRHLIRHVVILGYGAAALGVPMERAQDEAAGAMADEVIAAAIKCIRQDRRS